MTGRKFSILAAAVTATAIALSGVGLMAEPASQPRQLAQLNNNQGGGAAKKARKKRK